MGIASVLYGLLLFSLLAATLTSNESTAIISGMFALLNTLLLWVLNKKMNHIHRNVEQLPDTEQVEDIIHDERG